MTETAGQSVESPEETGLGEIINKELERFARSKEYLEFKKKFNRLPKLRKLSSYKKNMDWLNLNNEVTSLAKGITAKLSDIKESLEKEYISESSGCCEFVLCWQKALETKLPEYLQRVLVLVLR